MKRHYSKEEEFVDEFYNWAASASAAINYEWRPNENCSDIDRKQTAYFLDRGTLVRLTFSSATIERTIDERCAHIVLESSNRIITIKVSTINNEPIANIVVDRQK